MMEHAAIQGTFADLKSVKTRSVVQMVIEIPIEQAEQVVKAFGFPQPGAEIAVAVARMDPEKAKAAPAPTETPAKPKKPFRDYSLSQQAGMRCKEEQFVIFLHNKFTQAFKDMLLQIDTKWTSFKMVPRDRYKDVAREMVCELCAVVSRSEFDVDDAGAALWAGLNSRYEAWAGLATEQH